MSLLQRRVRDALPRGAMLPQQLRDAALDRIRFAPKLFGPVTLQNMVDVEPVWRPLLIALARQQDVCWIAVGDVDRSWFPGRLLPSDPRPPLNMRGELCSDPRAEVVEALRWARELLSRGNVSANDVAITTASPSVFDEHMLVLASQAGIPIHFSHGIPALSSWEGQSCAALADVLGNGLSQERVRRLMRHSSGTTFSLPDDWAKGLPPQAGLFTVDQWRRALRSARENRSDADAVENSLMPLLELLAQGFGGAEAAGRTLLGGSGYGRMRCEMLRQRPWRCRSNPYASAIPAIRRTASSGVPLPIWSARRGAGRGSSVSRAGAGRDRKARILSCPITSCRGARSFQCL